MENKYKKLVVENDYLKDNLSVHISSQDEEKLQLKKKNDDLEE